MMKNPILSVQRIWDRSDHNGMTDLIDFHGTLFCCFREGKGHTGELQNGLITILQSQNGKDWSLAAHIAKEGFDLRDPHFSITPTGTLMLTMGGSIYQTGEYITCYPHVAYSDDGIHWSAPQQIPLQNEWIWQVAWHDNAAYGFSYRLSDPLDRDQPWILTLYKSESETTYKPIKTFSITDYPSEATIRFTDEGQAIALLRRRSHAWIGTSRFPFTDWNWQDSGVCVGGPSFIILPDGSMWAGGRNYEINADDSLGYNFGDMAIGPMTLHDYKPTIILPNGGDNSYPGFAYRDPLLYVSYYSSHEGKACIYLAVIDLNRR